jgi:hypothetical protein
VWRAASAAVTFGLKKAHLETVGNNGKNRGEQSKTEKTKRRQSATRRDQT